MHSGVKRCPQMAQEDPLYDFPEPAPSSNIKRNVPQRAQGSLKSVSVLDRLLLTVPVWLQLSVNPATALHILQKEPPGAFLVRNSRTSRKNVLCVRLTDDSVPSFVQQFGIREQHSTFCLESSAISFPDLPRLIAFYCVSRDVLPFSLELPQAIAKATSHKQLESISHMGIEFWSSQLNYRGPRESPKAKAHHKTDPGATDISPQTPAAQLPSTAASDSLPQPSPANQIHQPPQSHAAAGQSTTSPTAFQKLCPITTRSPRELDCGSGALCFVNPLFIQPQSVLHRRQLFKRSLKVRVSTETTSSLSPPLAPPPPPPLMPKTRGKCKGKLRLEAQHPQRPAQGQTSAQPGAHSTIGSAEQIQGDQAQPREGPPGSPGPGGQEEDRTKVQVPVAVGPIPAGPEARDVDDAEARDVDDAEARDVDDAGARVECLQDESDYMEPSHVQRRASSPASPHLSHTPSPRESPSPFLKVSLSPHNSPSLSPYQSPSPSPMLPFSLTPFASPGISPTVEDPYHVPCSTPLRPGHKNIAEGGQELGDWEEKEDEEEDERSKDEGEEAMGLLLEQLYASSLNAPACCSSLSSSEGEEEDSLSPSPLPQLGVCPLASSSTLP
ncbi:unnamed protein product [Lota lota]